MELKDFKELLRKEMTADGADHNLVRANAEIALGEVWMEIAAEKAGRDGVSFYDCEVFPCPTPELWLTTTDGGQKVIECFLCGMKIPVKAACEVCERVFDPKVDPCEDNVCHNCLPKEMKRLREELAEVEQKNDELCEILQQQESAETEFSSFIGRMATCGGDGVPLTVMDALLPLYSDRYLRGDLRKFLTKDKWIISGEHQFFPSEKSITNGWLKLSDKDSLDQFEFTLAGVREILKQWSEND